MFLLKQILPAAILALAVAAAVSAFGAFCKSERVTRALAPSALALGYAAGHFLIAGWVAFPPADTTNWLPYFALAAAATGALSDSPKAPGRILLFGLICLGALRLLLEPKFRYGWSAGYGWMWVACLCIAIVGLAIILNLLGRRSLVASELPVFCLILSAGAAGALMLSGSMLLGQFAAVLAMSVIGTHVLNWRSSPVRNEGIAPVFSLLLGALLLSGYFFAELPAISAVLLAIAPVLALVPVGRLRAVGAFAVRVALVSLPVVVAVILAFRASPPLDY